MNNQVKAKIQKGFFNVIATVKVNIDDFGYGVSKDYLFEKLNRGCKTLTNLVNADVMQMNLGFEDTTLSLVEVKVDGELHQELLVKDVNSPRVNLLLNTNETDMSKLIGEVNLAKAQLTNVIADASKIAQKITAKPLSAKELEDLLSRTQNPNQVRNMLGKMSGPTVSVHIDDEVLSVGGYNLPAYCADGEVVKFHSCKILELRPNQKVIFDTFLSKHHFLTEDMDTSYMAVEVKDEIDFEYLKFVFAAKLVLDIEVRFSKHIATNHNKWWLVQILNRNQVSEEVLKKWMDIKARKS